MQNGTIALTLAQFDAISVQMEHYRFSASVENISITKNEYSISVCSGETLVAYVPLKTKTALPGGFNSNQ